MKYCNICKIEKPDQLFDKQRKQCNQCREKRPWKIKYKKYKPLTQPKKCVKCEKKTVRHAYHIMCIDCGNELKVCTKCGEAKERVEGTIDRKEQIKLDQELQDLLQSLSERKRRTFMRHMNKQANDDTEVKDKRSELIDKINALKMSENDDFDDYEEGDDDEGDGDGQKVRLSKNAMEQLKKKYEKQKDFLKGEVKKKKITSWESLMIN